MHLVIRLLASLSIFWTGFALAQTQGDAYMACMAQKAETDAFHAANTEPGNTPSSARCEQSGNNYLCKVYNPNNIYQGSCGNFYGYSACIDQPEGEQYFETLEPAATCVNGCEYDAGGGSCEGSICIFEVFPNGNVCNSGNEGETNSPEGCSVDPVTGFTICDCVANVDAWYCADPNNPPNGCVLDVATGILTCLPSSSGEPGDDGGGGQDGQPGDGGAGGAGGDAGENGSGGDGGDGGAGGQGGAGGAGGQGGAGGAGGSFDGSIDLTPVTDRQDSMMSMLSQEPNETWTEPFDLATKQAEIDLIKEEMLRGDSDWWNLSGDEKFEIEENFSDDFQDDSNALFAGVGGSCPELTYSDMHGNNHTVDTSRWTPWVTGAAAFLLWVSVAVSGWFLFFRWALV